MCFAFFPVYVSTVMHLLPRKNWCQVIRSAAPAMQHHFSKPEDLMLQNATHLRKSAPGPPNISDKHVSCTAPATENASLQILFKCSMPAIVFGRATKPACFAHFWQGAESLAPATQNHILNFKSGPSMWCFVHFDLEMCFMPQRRALFSTSQLPKVLRGWCAFCTLIWKCASRHNGMHFFDMSTSKSGLRMVCFVHFDFEMCFATTACTFSTSKLPKALPGWGALYILTWKFASRHNGVHFFDMSISKNWSENGLVCTFWLGNVLRATTACTVSTSRLPKGFQRWGDFSFFTAKVLRATRACNFLFLIWPDRLAPAALASPLFDPPEPQIIGKNTVFRDFSTFPRTCVFFLLALSLLWSSLFFSSLLFSDSSHLCFSICPHCRNFDF